MDAEMYKKSELCPLTTMYPRQDKKQEYKALRNKFTMSNRPSPQQAALLLNLPAELRNRVYEFVAYDSKEVIVFAHDFVLTKACPLSETCHQLRQEFGPIHCNLPISYATAITIYNTNFDPWDLILSLQRIPNAAPGCERKITFRIGLTNSLTGQEIRAFAKQLTEPAVAARTAASMHYEVNLKPGKIDLNNQRILFARLAKRYRYHCADAEQRVWEKIYWAFAEAAEKVDGVKVREFAMGAWKVPGGGFAFV
ncbi:hypothetical protein KC318_g2306 [Hortaea werneckii]|nr:hypothetical protein KC334_g2564 [Hortaea werneckii]KAI6966528.1 hypothetical protein KC355_g12131 [Hortaea werneckii]KAI7203413.1 hypothetical protein KC324_g1272 [Hortaea werneckii]KAI7593912.1 hypothetical protein KC316_g1449 [Hortaea werneckii]KAI7673306.1 hypothetical protein KC318_g2306 [Hortaea werneckii]